MVVKPEKTTILLGEPLSITVTIRGNEKFNPVIPDSLGKFEVLERMPVTTNKTNGEVVSTQQLTVTCFDSGQVRIPPVSVEGHPLIVSPGIDINVTTLPADDKSKYGDIKQIISLQPPNQWPYIAGLALATLLSAVGIYRLNSKRLAFEPAPSLPQSGTVSASNLLQQMERIRQDWMEERIPPIELGNRLMEIFRKYLSGKGIYSPSKTGEELVLATKNIYPAETWQQVVQSIRLCNAMRFGKYMAGRSEGSTAIDSFEKAITTNADAGNDAIKNA